jgi:hypothetical protein
MTFYLIIISNMTLSILQVEFAVPITELFMEKIDERNKLSAKLQTT